MPTRIDQLLRLMDAVLLQHGSLLAPAALAVRAI
ncbi:protein of unknown function [Paraburkholderia dioscoreae]|uniref:Uncharacterized protein n=1 Tax=Paraburkholderia dioscoreae TaxID=2604047 RepID=A0A5Q4ZVV2_9BURK|nr:protein of unknown function [Paraburkholderia dioscoreae]